MKPAITKERRRPGLHFYVNPSTSLSNRVTSLRFAPGQHCAEGIIRSVALKGRAVARAPERGGIVADLARWFRTFKQQVHQVVVAQLEQACEDAYVGIAEVMLISAEKTLEDQIVFQQAAPRAPAETRAA
jgi:hypothetical protein